MTRLRLRYGTPNVGHLAAVVAIGVLVLSGCSSTSAGHGSAAQPQSAHPPTAAISSGTSSATAQRVVAVHVSVNISDGSSVGVGMPYIATFNQKITDGRAFAAATKVTINGTAIDAQWYFEYSDPASGHLMEAHLRPQSYWPRNSRIQVDLPVQNLSGGSVAHHPGQVFHFDDSLTSSFTTTDAHILTAQDSNHTLTVLDNDKLWGTFPISLGASDTPTKHGIKVIMEKGRDVRMRGPGYDDPHVKWTQRLTYDGEYLHSAPWNCTDPAYGCAGPANNIGSYDSSNGCTNLRPTDAIKLYNFLGIGDVVTYPDANGPRMQLGDGFGDWNLTWQLWQTGGAIPTH